MGLCDRRGGGGAMVNLQLKTYSLLTGQYVCIVCTGFWNSNLKCHDMAFFCLAFPNDKMCVCVCVSISLSLSRYNIYIYIYTYIYKYIYIHICCQMINRN